MELRRSFMGFLLCFWSDFFFLFVCMVLSGLALALWDRYMHGENCIFAYLEKLRM